MQISTAASAASHLLQRLLVTAAASGLGRATAQAILRAGAKVFV